MTRDLLRAALQECGYTIKDEHPGRIEVEHPSGWGGAATVERDGWCLRVRGKHPPFHGHYCTPGEVIADLTDRHKMWR